MTARDVDVLVVGAGLSGLVCARRLRARGVGVEVWEARARVGGRLLTKTLAGAPVDLGGQWISAGQDRALALVRELGASTYPQVRAPAPIVDEPAAGFFGELGRAFGSLRASRALERLARRAAAAPSRVRELDDVSLAAHLARVIGNPVVRDRLALHADLLLAVEPADVSLLSYLLTLDATGGFGARAPELPGGGKEHRVLGGAHGLPAALAHALDDAVVLSRAVDRIAPAGERVVVRAAGVERSARRVVLAIPPAALRRIELPLPPAQRARITAASTGAVVKCFAAYQRPFWRERGAPPEVYRPKGLARATVEATVPGHAPALLSFVVGASARAWAGRAPSERRAALLAELAARLGPEARAPIDYVEHDWAADPWSAGCVVSYPPGALGGGDRYGQPVGRIHFAGAETAAKWPGYMDGAIEAAERAAAEVVAAMEKE